MREIIKIRLHKIVDLAVEGGAPYGMTEEEKRIFRVLRAFMEREELPEVPGEAVEVQEEVETEETVRKSVPREAYIIKVDLPKVLDTELREYGPFRAGDLVVIPPRSIGDVLVKRDAAERVRISP